MLPDPVLDALRKVCDDRARAAEDADAVDGVVPRYVAQPSSTAEVAEVLTVAAQHDLAVVPRGAGTKLRWGLPPTRLDLVLDTRRLSGVVDHASGDLVCVVRAGTRTAELQRVLAGAGQELALDLPFGDATVGGSIAVATSGPRRLLHGTMRDLLIGVTFVRADGVVATSGGRVVKNVAGYDLGKLLTGCYGTLGVVTEAVVRLHPLPAARRVVAVETAGPAQASAAAAAVLDSQLVPAAVEVQQHGSGPVTVTTLLQGVESGVAARVAAATALVAPYGQVTTGAEPPTAELPFDDTCTGLKVTVSASGIGAVLTTARELADVHQVELVVRGSAVGVLHAGLPAGTDPATVAVVVDALRATAATYGGGVTVLTAPVDVRAAVDVWGPVPGIELMRRLKDEMDPGHRLSPGRFVGGI